MRTMFSFCALASLVGVAVAVPVPEHFSERAKELLRDGIELNTPEEVGQVKHRLNVVYFVGNDREPLADYERRISELLLYVQQFYGKEMVRNGFGRRSLALPMLPNGNVEITVVRGSAPMAEYTYGGAAAGRALREINEFFARHPERKRSQHTFVIMPTQLNEEYSQDNPGGVPFFGLGRDCFALDYLEFDVKHVGQDTPYGHLLKKWLGGFAHELGHGLNLPHNKGIPADNAALGTALMGAGNYTFSMEPTYMTPASCAILDVCEVFPSVDHPDNFYAKPEVLLDKVEGSVVYRHGGFDVEIRMPLEQVADLKQVNFYMQDPPYVVNRDYDAVPFRGTISKKDNQMVVTCSMRAEDLADLKEGERQISAAIMLRNGFRYRWDVEFKMDALQDGQPVPFSKESLRVSSY